MNDNIKPVDDQSLNSFESALPIQTESDANSAISSNEPATAVTNTKKEPDDIVTTLRSKW